MKTFREKIVDVLINQKLVSRENLDKAIEAHRSGGGSLADILISRKLISQKDLRIVLSHELNIPPIDLSKYKVDRSLMQLISERVARQYLLVPVSRIGKVLSIAMSDPLNIFAIDDVRALTEYQIEVIIATEDDVREAISLYYGQTSQDILNMLEGSRADMDIETDSEDEEFDVSEAAAESQKAPIVKVVSLILNEAMKKRASDIHIEPCEKFLRVRYRIDGVMHDMLNLPKRNQNAVLARLKIMSKLDITETRMPQDGRFRISFEGKEIDFRVSVLPVVFGGKVVLRILDRSNLSAGLDKLGFLPGPLETFKTALSRPYCMILVTGPT